MKWLGNANKDFFDQRATMRSRCLSHPNPPHDQSLSYFVKVLQIIYQAARGIIDSNNRPGAGAWIPPVGVSLYFPRATVKKLELHTGSGMPTKTHDI